MSTAPLLPPRAQRLQPGAFGKNAGGFQGQRVASRMGKENRANRFETDVNSEIL